MKKIILIFLSSLVALFFFSFAIPTQAQVTASGFVQFNDLAIQNISAVSVPAEIVATLPGLTPGAPTPMNTCVAFPSASAASGFRTPCPQPPISDNAYRLEVSATTQLILRDRTTASLSDFSTGDQISVYGYYNTDGSIAAYVIRDISKPAETQTIQLNNATLNSISIGGPGGGPPGGVGIQATLAVTQTMGSPCLGFTPSGSGAPIACPMGVSAFSANPSTANVTELPALAPMWQALRKYVVNVDSHTVILDRNRTQLSLSSLNLGDSLNVYGESSDGGQTISADIIRDLSIPATASSYTGTVTSVNSDGSFVMQMSNGQTVTVQNPVSVGQTVNVQGTLNVSNSTISAISALQVE